MTAQPEVVWVSPEGIWREQERPSMGPLGPDVPYVPQASLTAALAERDQARREAASWKERYANVTESGLAAMAERDKLAHPAEQGKYTGYSDPVGSSCAVCRGEVLCPDHQQGKEPA